MWVVKFRNWFFILSIILISVSIYGAFAYGFNLGIDFRGGTITEMRYVEARPDKEMIESAVSSLNLGGFSVRPAENDRYVIRTKELSSEEREALVQVIGNPIVERQNTIGPVAGAELKSKAVKAVSVVVVMIVLFVTFAFRKATSPWKYGLATIVALIHDIIIPIGVFTFLGKLYGLEINLLFIGGLLAILGYSVHDTIVVFDRVRENLRVNQERNITEEFEATIGKSVIQTMARSINTSFTLLIVLVALYFIGSMATKDLTLLLIIGVIAGTYSSIFIASPLLVSFHKLQKS